jgi:hypothetical protein
MQFSQALYDSDMQRRVELCIFVLEKSEEVE